MCGDKDYPVMDHSAIYPYLVLFASSPEIIVCRSIMCGDKDCPVMDLSKVVPQSKYSLQGVIQSFSKA